MGYTTDFNGEFTLDRELTKEHTAYLHAFAGTRRMKRNATETEKYGDSLREAVGLPIGAEGGYFVGSQADFGQEHTPDVIDYNSPPQGQPGLWCQWVPTDDAKGITWDGSEKFYSYVEWLEYLIEHFLEPWGYVLNGNVEWSGEERHDIGMITVTDNRVEAKHGRIVY